MEFLDPKKQRAHLIRLFIGYVLIGTALILTTVILLYQAYGFGYKNGEVIQNGLIFVSSIPESADIFVNGQRRDERTNARLLMPAGQYSFELKRDGYRSWKRAINLEGGTVARFDYPMLFPTKITTDAVKKYDARPLLTTQSPDHRWIIVQNGAYTSFDVFDTTKPDKAPVAVALSEAISSLGGTHNWKLVEWSNDNRHLLLQHTADNNGKQSSEYILMDREDPAASLNLTARLGLNPTKVELRDKKYDQYYIYTAEDQHLSTATLEQPKPELLIDQVLAFKGHGDTVLYATAKGAVEGKTVIKLYDNEANYVIRTVTAGSNYLLDLAQYEGAWYVVAGAPSENRTYVYEDPAAALTEQPKLPLVPVQVLKTSSPTRVSFSSNTRFIVAQNGQQFSVYDAENEKGYTYNVAEPFDAVQEYAVWMDGHRLFYMSGGKVVVFDYDHTNKEALVTADPAYSPFVSRDGRQLYAMVAQAVNAPDGKESIQYVLSSSWLRTPADR